MATGENPEVAQLIPVNLATACLESFLYGLFFVLYGASTYLLVRQGQEKLVVEGLRSRTNSVYKAPMFIAAHIIFLNVTGVSPLLDVRCIFLTHESSIGSSPCIDYFRHL